MKAVLEFDLDDGDDTIRHRQAVQGAEWEGLVWDMDQRLRCKIKHGDLPEAVCTELQSLRDFIREELGDRGLSFSL